MILSFVSFAWHFETLSQSTPRCKIQWINRGQINRFGYRSIQRIEAKFLLNLRGYLAAEFSVRHTSLARSGIIAKLTVMYVPPIRGSETWVWKAETPTNWRVLRFNRPLNKTRQRISVPKDCYLPGE